MKNFNDIEKGDTVYLIEIHDSELPKENAIKELEVISVEHVKNTCHLRVLLSDSTLIAPSGLFPFHSVNKNELNDPIQDVNEEVYSTDRNECLRIAINTFQVKMKQIQRLISKCKEYMSKFDKAHMKLLELKINCESEVIAETVLV